MSDIYQFSANDINNEKVDLESYRDKVLLVVNTASRCGFTPQYQGLEALYRTYKEQGFVVLAFPCNQFGQQEPGTGEDIQQFCTLNYEVSFPLFEKIEVNGSHTHPLYCYLKNAAPGLFGSTSIKWNFTKFLIGRDGKVVRRYGSMTSPNAIRAEIDHLLKKPQ